MFKKYQIILVALILSLALVFVGCGNKDNQDTPPVLSATEIELSVGESKQLTVNDYEGLVEWGTDDFKTISVADDGTVSGIAVGQATITAYLEDGTELTCKVVCKIAYVSVPKIVLDGEIEQDNKYTISGISDNNHGTAGSYTMIDGGSQTTTGFQIIVNFNGAAPGTRTIRWYVCGMSAS